MEEILPHLKDKLANAVDISYDDLKLIVTLKIKPQISGILASLEEISTMFKMFGEIEMDIPMEVSVDNEDQQISIRLQNEEHFSRIKNTMRNLWENAVNMLDSLLKGDYKVIKDIPSVDD